MVSIIVPVYNVGLYLRQCLDSILRQTYKEFEVILVDDGSTDSSGVICDEYVQIDKRFRVIHKKNGGQSSARNAALDIAQGDYICFIDSDDYISFDYLENVALIEKKGVDVVKCGYELFGEANDVFKLNDATIFDKDDLFVYWMTTDSYLWNRIYKREIFEKHRFKEGMIMEDVFLIPDLLSDVKSICLSSKGTYFYRIRKGSTVSKKHTPKILRDILNAYLKYIDICYNENYTDLFYKFYATYLTGYFETKANFKNVDFSDIKKRYLSYRYTIIDVCHSSLSLRHKIKLIATKILGIDTVALLYVPFFHYFHPKAIKE